MKNILILIFTLFIFVGCSSKGVDTPSQNKKITEQSSNQIDLKEEEELASEEEFSDEDEFLDEFEEEMAVEEVYDPLSGYNRAMTSFNDYLFRNVVTPVAKGYKAVVPEGARESVKNFFHNLMYPVRGINNLLQGKFSNTAEETGRFVINSTIGIFGLFDPAKSWFGLEAHEEDFGQTLGYYGVSGGPHIVLPFLGPSNLRDMFSMYPDSYVDPTAAAPNDSLAEYHIPNTFAQSLAITAVDRINYVSLHVGEYELLTDDAVDKYTLLRDAYEQRRKKLIEE